MSRATTPPVAAVTAGVLGALALALASARLSLAPLALVRLVLLGGALGPLVLYDISQRRIPNRIVLPATLACAVLSLAEGIQLSVGLLAGVLLVAVLLVVALANPESIGMGDVKLALLLLCALHAVAARALLIALELYALCAVALLIRHGRTALKSTLPLAPVFAAGCLIAVLA